MQKLYTFGFEKKCSGRIMISALDLFVSCATGILNIIVAIVYEERWVRIFGSGGQRILFEGISVHTLMIRIVII